MSNPNTIPWMHYQDIQIPDLNKKSKFDALMQQGDYAEALKFLQNNNLELKGKAYISETINKILKGVLILQNTFNIETNIFLSDLAKKYIDLIDNLGKKEEWNVTLQYIPYNFVTYKNKIYMCIQDSIIGEPPKDSSSWVFLDLQGTKGVEGVNVTMRYSWNSLRDYKTYDIVAYDGNLYVALKDNKNIIPNTDDSVWLVFLLVEKGKIFIGVDKPNIMLQNTIWFKTESDPLLASNKIVGKFLRFTNEDVWEEMYPKTLFELIEGTDNLAPLSKIIRADIQVEDWIKDIDKYYYEINNQYILNSSWIEVYLNNKNLQLYSFLSIEVVEGKITFITKEKPKFIISLIIDIQ